MMASSPSDPGARAAASAAPLAVRRRLRRRVFARVGLVLRQEIGTAAAAVRGAPHRLRLRFLEALRRGVEVAPGPGLRLVRGLRRLAPGAAFPAQAEAMLVARTRGWEAAAPLFLAPAACARRGAAAVLLRLPRVAPVDLAVPARDRPADLPEAEAQHLVVYTAAFGDAPAPLPVFPTIPGLRFVCLSDRADRAAPGWEVVTCTPPVAEASRAAWCRILAHRALAEAVPQAEASLYLDPDRWIVGNLHTLLGRWLLPHDLVLWRHPGGSDWQDLVERHLSLEAPGDPAVLAQAQETERARLHPGGGVFDTGAIWRRHAAPEVRALMEAWWQRHHRTAPGPGLDAISLYGALNDPAAPAPVLPRTLPATLGSAEDNAFLARRQRISPGAPSAPAVRTRPLRVACVYAEKYAASASTFLRGRQLSEMVARRYAGEIDMVYTSDLDGIEDRVVVLTKGALEVHSADEIEGLRRRNAAVVGSWDDMLPDPVKLAVTDASMTLSHRQTLDLARLHPGTPAFMVTHHVNAQIRPMTPPKDRLRVGYFGYLANTHRPPSLGRMIEMIGIDTSKVEMSWLDALPHYNCHWIVRRSKAHDGWKPFLKGFVAARCGAVVAVGREDEDAVAYLGDDYPFYVRSPDPARLEYDMAGIAAAFGGPEWRRAEAIMAQVAARSSDDRVCAEFRSMVAALAG